MKTSLLTFMSALLLLLGTVLNASAYSAGETFEVSMGLDGLTDGSYNSSKPAYYKFKVNEDGNTCTLVSAQFQNSGVLPQQYRKNINIVIPATAEGLTVTAIGSSVFSSCSNVKSITIPETVKEIGNNSFKGCCDLVTLDLGGVEKIGNGCFSHPSSTYQTALKSVDLSNVKYIGNNSFLNFPNLTSVELSPELESLGTGCFQGCPKVELEFPEDSRYAVIDNIVYECNGTGADKQPVSLLMLQPNFNGSDITLPATVTSIATRAFEDNTNLRTINLGNVQTVGNYTFMNCKNLTTVMGSENIVNLGSSAFSGCTSLNSFSIGTGCTADAASIAKALEGCTGLQSFVVEEGNPNCRAEDGVLFNKEGTTLVSYMCDNKTEYSVPAGVTTIANGAFNNVGSTLTDLTIGNDVTNIGSELFLRNGASSLEHLTLGSEVESIGNMAFYYCANIRTVACDALTPPTIPSQWVFSYNTCNNAELIVPEEATDAYMNANGWKEAFGNRVTTGVENAMVEDTEGGAYYNLQGIRIDNPRSGHMYIHNGKKLIYR